MTVRAGSSLLRDFVLIIGIFCAGKSFLPIISEMPSEEIFEKLAAIEKYDYVTLLVGVLTSPATLCLLIKLLL